MKTFNQMLDSMHMRLSEVGDADIISKTKKQIHIVQSTLSDLKEQIKKKGFSTIDEEINFFKHEKPQMLGLLLYFAHIHKIESKRPPLLVEDYLTKELLKLKIPIEDQKPFYEYYHSKATSLDHIYFVRGYKEIEHIVDYYYFDMDKDFSTGYDYLISLFISIEKIQDYITKEIQKLGINPVVSSCINNTLKWTSTKAGLVELIYGIQLSGLINNGNIKIKELTIIFEELFNIELENIYNIFIEISARKTVRTPILDMMKKNLIAKMDENL